MILLASVMISWSTNSNAAIQAAFGSHAREGNHCSCWFLVACFINSIFYAQATFGQQPIKMDLLLMPALGQLPLRVWAPSNQGLHRMRPYARDFLVNHLQKNSLFI